MQHFFVEPSQIREKEIVITGEDVNHIKNVLRMKTGEELSVSDGAGDREYRCEIAVIRADEVICKLRFIKENGVELPLRISLFQGLPKADKMELIIQKAVELGAYEIVPVATARSVVKINEKKEAAKIARWQAIAEAAAKQSKRAIIPSVREIMTMAEAVGEARKKEVSAIPYELAEGMADTKDFFRKITKLTAQSSQETVQAPGVGILIGPEGGFTEDEILLAKDAGITPISLGRRILRTETAGMTLLSSIMLQLETEGITEEK